MTHRLEKTTLQTRKKQADIPWYVTYRLYWKHLETHTWSNRSKHPGNNLFDQGRTTNDGAAHGALAVIGGSTTTSPVLKSVLHPDWARIFQFFVCFLGGHNAVANKADEMNSVEIIYSLQNLGWVSFAERAIVHVSDICTGVRCALHPGPRIESWCSIWSIRFCGPNGLEASAKFGRETKTTGMIPEVH